MLINGIVLLAMAVGFTLVVVVVISVFRGW